MSYFGSIYQAELPHRARAVYMYLKDRAGKDGTCWPAIGTIARELSLSRSTVKRAITDLVGAGFVVKGTRYRENGSKTSCLYTVK
ncbi:MAG: helix-turn-helix domain-containing protein [Oscillospiraceae bacterium]|nr:helix-turn-helix domain-containing protein [Oscillospiraceae bacterium]